MSGFKRATKAKSKLRAAFSAVAGGGKTFTSLRVGTGLADGGRIALIDTERGSASKYSDRFEFDVLELEDKSINGYISAISMAADAGYAVLIIDSLSHAWQELLEEVERLAKAKYRGNTWSAWSEGTPMQRKLIDAILNFPGHVIATMRAKTEWQTTTDSNGRNRPVRVGLAPEQGKGIEYEFDLLLEISTDHVANVIKDRTGKFQDKLIDRPGEVFGTQLAQWLADGVSAKPEQKTEPQPQPKPPIADEAAMAKARGAIDSADSADKVKKFKGIVETRLDDGFYSSEQASELLDMIEERIAIMDEEVAA